MENQEKQNNNFFTHWVKRDLNNRNIFNAMDKVSSMKDIPSYYICRESNVDFNKYKKALYCHDQLEDQEIQRLTKWIVAYFGLNLKGIKVKW